MTESVPEPVPGIRVGSIYRDVYAKRIDDDWTRQTGKVAEADLEVAEIRNRAISFGGPESMRRAMNDGVFFLKIPASLDVSAGDEFAASFYGGAAHEPYGRFRDLGSDLFGDPLLGFHQRVNQIEQFLLERRFWAASFPKEILRLGEELTQLSQRVVEAVLMYSGIPRSEWERATGGCSHADGSYHLTFNHYRPQLLTVGLNSHKDDGFVTLLRTTQPGLQVNRLEHWEAVPVDRDRFVVNFGLAMQILTVECTNRVAAIMHRVTHQQEDRSSFGHFSSSRCEPGRDAGIYQYAPGAGLRVVCSSRDLIDSNDHEIYEGTDHPESSTP